MNISRLYIELTRECDLACYYCLRGEAQNLCFDISTLGNMFDGISNVDELIFSGGEPVKGRNIIDVISSLIPNNVRILSFKTVTSFASSNEENLQFIRSMENIVNRHAVCPDLCRIIISRKNGFELPKYQSALISDSDPRNFVVSEFGHPLIATCNSKVGKNPSYLNGFEYDRYSDKILSDVYVSSNGNVTTSCDLSYDQIDKLYVGNLKSESLKSILSRYSLEKEEIKVLEIGISGPVSFEQYWDSLSEDKRGDWFGYALSKMLDRNLPGYGMFKLLEAFPSLATNPLFEDFNRILQLKSEVIPPWCDEKEAKHTCNVLLTFFGYMRMMSEHVFASNPVLRLIDLYYSDMPYSATERLKPFLEKLIK